MFVVYVTHPQVVIDPAVPIPDWGLSALGCARAEEAAQLPWVRSLARVVTSAERARSLRRPPLGAARGRSPKSSGN